jgi:uncharacterized membrane protein
VACRLWKLHLGRERIAATLAAVALLVVAAAAPVLAGQATGAAEPAGGAAGVWMHLDRALPLGLGLIVILIGRILGQVPPNERLGIRTPWTVKDERVWIATHRLAGRTFAVGGAITMAGALLPGEYRPYTAIAGLAIAGFVPVVYSFFALRARGREPGA